jgi:hypothetical protein
VRAERQGVAHTGHGAELQTSIMAGLINGHVVGCLVL